MRPRVPSFSYDDSSEVEPYSASSRHDQSKGASALAQDDDIEVFRVDQGRSRPVDVLWTSEAMSAPAKGGSHGCCGLRKRFLVVLVIFLIVLAFLFGLMVGGLFIDMSKKKNNNVSSSGTSEIIDLYPRGDILVGAYYYPWHADDFHGGTGYVRDQLSPRQEPTLGEYDDSEPETITQHLAWSRQANIHLWVNSWRGDGKREDLITREVILPHSELQDHQISLLYETFGRIREEEEFSLHRVVPDIEHICDHYFGHPNYLRMDGKPVLFVYLTRKLERLGLMDNVVTMMREAAMSKGYELYIVADHAFRDSPDNIFSEEDAFNPFTSVDAITNYDVYGSVGKDGYAGEDGVKAHYAGMASWKQLALSHGCRFIPSASPGYNDQGVRPEENHYPLSRKLTAESEFGSLFSAGLREARRLVDPGAANILMITSFNEWHEDTQIEPVIGGTTTLPEEVTYGLEYDGYGELYLDILREQTLYS